MSCPGVEGSREPIISRDSASSSTQKVKAQLTRKVAQPAEVLLTVRGGLVIVDRRDDGRRSRGCRAAAKRCHGWRVHRRVRRCGKRFVVMRYEARLVERLVDAQASCGTSSSLASDRVSATPLLGVSPFAILVRIVLFVLGLHVRVMVQIQPGSDRQGATM